MEYGGLSIRIRSNTKSVKSDANANGTHPRISRVRHSMKTVANPVPNLLIISDVCDKLQNLSLLIRPGGGTEVVGLENLIQFRLRYPGRLG